MRTLLMFIVYFASLFGMAFGLRLISDGHSFAGTLILFLCMGFIMITLDYLISIYLISGDKK